MSKPVMARNIICRYENGKNSRLIICGDIGQNDLASKRGECSGFLVTEGC